VQRHHERYLGARPIHAVVCSSSEPAKDRSHTFARCSSSPNAPGAPERRRIRDLGMERLRLAISLADQECDRSLTIDTTPGRSLLRTRRLTGRAGSPRQVLLRRAARESTSAPTMAREGPRSARWRLADVRRADHHRLNYAAVPSCPSDGVAQHRSFSRRSAPRARARLSGPVADARWTGRTPTPPPSACRRARGGIASTFVEFS